MSDPPDSPDPVTTLGDRATLTLPYLGDPTTVSKVLCAWLGPGRCGYMWGGMDWDVTLYLRPSEPEPSYDPTAPTRVVAVGPRRDVVTLNERWRRFPHKLRYGDVVRVVGLDADAEVTVHRPSTGETFR